MIGNIAQALFAITLLGGLTLASVQGQLRITRSSQPIVVRSGGCGQTSYSAASTGNQAYGAASNGAYGSAYGSNGAYGGVYAGGSNGGYAGQIYSAPVGGSNGNMMFSAPAITTQTVYRPAVYAEQPVPFVRSAIVPVTRFGPLGLPRTRFERVVY